MVVLSCGLIYSRAQDHQPADAANGHVHTRALHARTETHPRSLILLNTCALHAVSAACSLTDAAAASHMLGHAVHPCQGCWLRKPAALDFAVPAAGDASGKAAGGWRGGSPMARPRLPTTSSTCPCCTGSSTCPASSRLRWPLKLGAAGKWCWPCWQRSLLPWTAFRPGPLVELGPSG